MKDKTIKILDHGFIRVVDIMGTDVDIVNAARISYGDGTTKTNNDSGLINYLMRYDHTTPFEMCEIKLHIKAPIFVARQWLRHRTASVNEYSARYSVVKDSFYLPELEQIKSQSVDNKQCSGDMITPEAAQDIRDAIQHHSERSYEMYLGLTQTISRETARMILPVNFYTEFYWKIDLHNYMHFVRLRAHPHAQYEIRVYAEQMIEILKEWCPITYSAFMEHRVNSLKLSATAAKAIAMSIESPQTLGGCFDELSVHKRERREIVQHFYSHKKKKYIKKYLTAARG